MQSHSGNTRGSSSVGRAQPCQGWGREFEPRLPLQIQNQGHLRMTLNFEKELRLMKIHPTGFNICQSSLCTRPAFFFIYPRRGVYPLVPAGSFASLTGISSLRSDIPQPKGICAVAMLPCTSLVPAGRALANEKGRKLRFVFV